MNRVWPVSSEPRSRSHALDATDSDLRELFMSLTSARDVARLLDVPYWQLTYLLHRSPPGQRYEAAEIAKKSGGIRQLLIPRGGLMAVQRKLAQVLSSAYRPKPCVVGFVPGGSVVKNARRHVRRPWVLNVDIQDFFPKINFGRVRGMFKAKPYSLPDPVATILAQICCHNNQLPQGAPTSPVVSNMVCAKLDGDLIALAKRYRLTYTRFADDLTFSTTMGAFPPEIAARTGASPLATLGPELASIMNTNGFTPNPSKCRLQSSRERQEVTGITVTVFPNVPRMYVKRIRAMLHAWEKFGYAAAEAEYLAKHKKRHRAVHRPTSKFKHVIRGHLAYLSMVRGATDPIVLSLRGRYGKLDPAYAPRQPPPLHTVVCDSLWVLECDDLIIQGTAFGVATLGILTCEHVLGSENFAFRTSQHGQRVPVTVLARSKELDLALLSLPIPITAPLHLNVTYEPKINDQVFVAGFPNHQTGDSGHYLSQSVVSLRSASGHTRALVTGPIAAGMSGGPVVDGGGKVIGVIVSGAEQLSQANMTERHGFVPMPTILEFLKDNGWSIDQGTGQLKNAADEQAHR